MNVERRLAALRRRLEDSEATGVIVSKAANVAYLTGFEGVFDAEPNSACVVTTDSAVVYTDFRFAEAAEAAAEGGPWTVTVPVDNLYQQVCRDLQERGVTTLAVESSVPFGRFKYISEHYEGRVDVLEQLVEEIRQVKEPEEIDRIGEAAALTDRAMAHALELLAARPSERDLALDIELFMRRNGSEGVAFAPIVASGPNSSLPHAVPTDRRPEPGDLVTIDIGARVRGYCADLTRTVVIGRADERQREVYEAVLSANAASLAACRGGLRGSDLHDVAKSVLVDLGFGEAFGHGLGHGVGLEVHELPTAGPRGDATVRTGSVLTIEPGVYLRGWGGVRIEDLVVVEPQRCRVLSSAPKDLIEIV